MAPVAAAPASGNNQLPLVAKVNHYELINRIWFDLCSALCALQQYMDTIRDPMKV
jgi:hypothetical protein